MDALTAIVTAAYAAAAVVYVIAGVLAVGVHVGEQIRQ